MKRRVLSTIILVIAVVVLLIAVYNIFSVYMNYKISEDTYRELATEYTEETEEELEPWKTVVIDFDSLKAINPDVVAWIKFDDTESVNVDYPIMYSTETDKYLHTNLYGEYFYAGSIFLEENNSPDFSDMYNIIYGHNMRNGTMFGTLRKFRDDEDFYENNKYFTIYTPEATYRYEIFAYENVSETGEIFTTGYEMDDVYQGFIDRIVASSMRDTGIYPTMRNKIVSLSTCTSAGDRYRFVVSAVCTEACPVGGG